MPNLTNIVLHTISQNGDIANEVLSVDQVSSNLCTANYTHDNNQLWDIVFLRNSSAFILQQNGITVCNRNGILALDNANDAVEFVVINNVFPTLPFRIATDNFHQAVISYNSPNALRLIVLPVPPPTAPSYTEWLAMFDPRPLIIQDKDDTASC